MNLVKFLNDLSVQGVELWSDGDHLSYRAPKDLLTPIFLSKIKQHKAEILQLLHNGVRTSRTYPLSHGQQALWFLYRLVSETAAYNVAFTARIHSHLDIAALRQAFQTLIDRHPILRITFREQDGVPVQEVNSNQEVYFKETDASTWNWDELNRKVIEAYQHPFDLERGPVLRVNLFTRSQQDHVLLLCVHHIACDAWSLWILLDELRLLYPVIRSGVQASLAPHKFSYQDYVSWQSQMLGSLEGERLWAYWKQQLAGELPVLNLPTDRPRPLVQTYQGASQVFKLSEELTSKLRGMAQAERVTLYMILLAAFQVLLHRLSGQEDILVGSPTVGRSQTEFAPIVGYFVNPIVLRAQISSNSTFKAFLAQVRLIVLEAIAHQDYPFPLLVERLQPHRDPSRSSLFQVLFILQKPQQEGVIDLLLPSKTSTRVDWGGLLLEPFEMAQQEGQFDLTLEIVEAKETLFGVLGYNTDLFDAETITRMTGHFQTLLEGIVAHPEQQIAELPLLTEVERHQLLWEWNDTSKQYPQDQCIHQLFEQQVERTPEAVAVVFENQQLTYRELNCRANKVAHYLKSLGVEADMPVGICVERSLEMVVGLLGILKAGGAYVPLDPTYPQQRLSFMLSDSRISILLTQQRLVEELPEHGATIVCLDEDNEQIDQHRQENPVSGVMASHLAYVIYTSGSTGKPKGVMVTHSGLCNFTKAQIQNFNMGVDSRILQFASFSFDASIAEFMMALGSGATLYIGTKISLLPGPPLIQLLRDYRITHITLPPSALAVLPTEELPALQTIILAGEACSIDLIRQWSANRRLFNAYGPTEATICTTLNAFCDDDKPLIGRPIANTQVYILDQHGQPVPVGVPGELHIGGAGLARGYLNQAELTAEKFIDNPFSDRPLARLYKTGDLARYRSDGKIEYLGRIDNQVKIRGFRIELAEIEAILSQHADVRQTTVIAREDTPGSPRLVAYLVRHQKSAPTISDLRRFVASKLPEYMIPSAFVFLEALPLTPNGKIDRRALPVPDLTRERAIAFVAPRTPSEEMLALIWGDVLGVELVGIHDNFFELGGHSLLATQLISRVRTTFGMELPLRSLFQAATIADLAEHIQQWQREVSEIAAPPLRPAARDAALPLSFAQQRLWFLDQLEPNSTLYNMPVAVRLQGQLQLTALEQSFQEIIRRHEALRTNFITQDGQPIQVINPDSFWQVSILDLRHLSESERELSSQQLATTAAHKPFDLGKEPLVRATLLVLEETEHILLLTMHHIISDGWSMGVIVKELAALYSAFCQGQPSPLAELPIQYADFAVWQRQWLQGDVVASQLSYWQQQLRCAPALLSLPTAGTRPALQTFQGAHKSFALSFELTEALSLLSRQEGVTLFMTLLAAFDILLYRYTGTEDILVGSPIANRNRSEVEGLIGFFVNTLVLRTNVSGNPSFRELLGRVREVALGAYAHQDLPFEMLVEALQPERDLSHTPLFQVMFILQNAPMPKVELPGLILSPLSTETSTAAFDLTLSMEKTVDGLVGSWEYNTDLFDAETITRMTGHFQTLLEEIVAHPEQQIAELPLLTEVERHQLLWEWNDTSKQYPQDQCIHQLFEQQVERTPEAVAVVFENQQLTYRELNCRANKVAHYLKSLGVEADMPVGICVERSLEMVVGLLGILKAGGAYVPLDPTYPQQRLSFMLSDSRISILLTQQRLVEELPEHEAMIVCLDTDWRIISQSSQENDISKITSENSAYVIYTSGSTGKPKGVIIQHQSLVNFTQTTIVEYGLSRHDRVLQFASISFDTAAEEIYPSLACGATLVLRTKEMLSSIHTFMQKSRDWGITVLDLPTAYWHQVTSELATTNLVLPDNIRLVIIGGERALPEKLRMWHKLVGSFPQLVNTYGPTETTVIATLCKFSDAVSVELDGQEVPIGYPIHNVQVYILDQHGQPVPVGVPGELHIGGAGLARGYLNQAELTAEKFIDNPFSDRPLARLYKTGDLARYRSDGKIEYLGRIDNQVKIRGFRIELAEIEAILSQHADVRQTTVIAREDTPGSPRLVAYLVRHQESAPTISDLRRFVASKLPEYMIPSAFVFLEALPLTPNGKIDRRALPVPDLTRERAIAFVAPRTPSEEMLALIWGDVLGVELVGIHDNFFELGGHSLLATQLISRVRTTFGMELPLRSLFQAATIADLAEHIQQWQREVSEIAAPPLRPAARDAALPLSFAQQRLWFLDQLEPNSTLYNMPVAVRLQGQLQLTALEQSFQEIIRRHEALRTNFITQDGQPIQVINPDSFWQVSILDLRHLSESERELSSQQLATTAAHKPFDLGKEPLVRATLLVLEETEHILLLTMHHIISDGWSMGVIVKELAALYSAFCQGQPSPLAELPIQYADFAVWQRQWLQGDVVASQLSYWQQQLRCAPALLSLPTAGTRPALQTFQGAHKSFALSFELTEALSLLSRKEGVTLFMTLLAAFDILLYRYTGTEDILVGSPIANRNRSEVEGLIGFFVNTLVLRTNVSGNPSFRELLGRVREVALGAYAHQDLPFEMLVEALQPERDLSHTPLFQVMFILQNAPMPKVELPGLTLSPLSTETSTAKFDLTLSMEKTVDGLVGSWEYNTDLFDAETITRMTGHFQTLLEEIVAHPEQQIAELPLLTEVERHQLLWEWNDTSKQYPQDQCIHQLFEQQVERTPEAVAVVFENQQLTYRELNCRANKVAHYLKSLGVEADMPIGICVERSLEMVVGLLGILKAGGAYVPLDPTYPQQRLSFMLSDSRISILLTQEKLVAELPDHEAQILCLDTDWHNVDQQCEKNFVSGVTSNNLAYLIYTSGSTGKPKGVQILHSALVNFLFAMHQQLEITEQDVFLGVTTLAFDIAALELFLPMTVGACVVVASREVTFNGKQLLDLLVKCEATVMQATPATWRLLLEAEWQSSNQIKILCGGEALSLELANKLEVRSTSLWNLYGPTETTIWSLINQVESEESLISIGRPIANTQVYILDQHRQLVPVGVPGELHIGGAGLARGYLNQAELTAEKFIDNPFSDDPLARLYKTGDLACYRSDGKIEYLGRIDNQVKIRGFRIELAEIEAILSQHADVQQTTVIAREDTPGSPRLVAYLVRHQESAPTISDLRRFVASKLPEYMIPSAFVFLEALPLTPNGKIDRRALPVPDSNRLAVETSFVPPLDTVEYQLAHIWTEVLNVYPVGVRDNFFELGGHSLLAVQLMARIEQQFQKNLPLATLFQNSTIEQLATLVRQPINASSWSPLVPIQSSGSKQPFFCVPGAGGNCIYLYTLAHHLGKEQPFYGLQSLGLDGESKPHTRIEDMAADYIEAIQSVQPQGPYFLGGHSFGGMVAFEMANQLHKLGHEVALLALLDSGEPGYLNNELVSHVDDAGWLNKIADLFENFYGKSLNVSYNTLKYLAPDEQLNYFQERLQMANLLPPNVGTRQLGGLLQVFKSNHQTASVYMPQEVYPNRITFFRASEIDAVSSLPSDIVENSEIGWGKFSVQPLDIQVVPGSHITMLSEPHVQVLAEYLRTYLS